MPAVRERIEKQLRVPASAAKALTKRQMADRGLAVLPPVIFPIPDHSSEARNSQLGSARTAASGKPGFHTGLPS